MYGLKPLMKKQLDSFYFLLTYSAGELACALLEQPDYLSLLCGGTSAANHSRTLTCKFHELILIVFQTNLQETHQNRRVSNLGAYN